MRIASGLEHFMQESWLIIFFISIIFIFIIIFRELGKQTRSHKKWSRISYYKIIPRVSLSFQHFSRRGELLSITNNSICRSVHRNMLDYLMLRKGLSESELENLLQDKELLFQEVPNENAVEFLYDINTWLRMVIPEPSFLDRVFGPIISIIRSGNRPEDEKFYLELATVIHNFRSAIDTIN